MTSEELQAKVSKLEQQTEKNAKAIAKLNKQVNFHQPLHAYLLL